MSELRGNLDAGRTSSVALTEAAIARAEDPDGEGDRAFIARAAGRARAEAQASDRLRAAGLVPSPVAGLPISVKDLFDVAGEVIIPTAVPFGALSLTSLAAAFVSLIGPISNSSTSFRLIVKPRVENDVSLLVARTVMLCEAAASRSSSVPSATVTTPVIALMAKRPPALSSSE